MKQFGGKILRNFLVLLFSSYYFLMVALNYSYIENRFSPLKIFNLSKITALEKETYIGTYPNQEDIQMLKNKKHIKRIISFLNPNIPIARELDHAERDYCKKAHIELINIPNFSPYNIGEFSALLELLSDNTPTYIHAYFYGNALKIIHQRLQNRELQNH
ncbi:hypothetical protein MNB_SV-3-1582 [hydrothermal vent metagenome]|uniref:Uncharacterized protein n=1 Tax=hydrothermal vent metagenome TaxID=652676 RepID=A0A1W1CA00_9ZZZZ